MTAFTQLYSSAQLQQFTKVRDALVADPKALDNRGSAADTVAALDTHIAQDAGNGHS